MRVHELEELTKRRFFLVGIDDVHLDHFRVLDRGDVARLEPSAPVEVGQELELKLGEVGLHDPHAGVGKVKDFDVVVAGAATLVGKKVKVRIGAVEEGVAYAERLDAAAAEGPITAEAEAEKPTRARKAASPKKEKEAAVDEVETEVEEEAGEAAEPAAAKKKTRRGTRGGRNRKKKTTTAPPAEAVNGDEPADAEAEAPAAPVIHLPGRELDEEPSDNGDEPAPPPKRPTRRGSRGGRNRKKKTATAASPAPAAVEAVEAEAEPDQNGDAGEWEYTPISDWGDE
jgi:predicted RNA-binding protein with TRAM domain